MPKVRDLEDGFWAFWCPGCGHQHVLPTEGEGHPNWQFNGNPESPTFSPSIMARGHKVKKDERGRWSGEWERDSGGGLIPEVCHSFVTDGRIQFLPDCTHGLAGQTVDLPEHVD